MKKVVLIPARYSSSRLPGKPLLDLQGKPMIVRVCESVQGQNFDEVVVATDDQRIFDAVVNEGFNALMTRSDHVSGTDRLYEASEQLQLSADDIVINLQGDEPLMPPENLNQVAALLENNDQASVATLYEDIRVSDAKGNPNVVKLVQSASGEVLYFSRADIPFDRDNILAIEATSKRHVGVYAYRKSALDSFVSYPEGELERLEKLEQLRFMENGHRIVACKSEKPIPIGVDTQEDLDAVRELFKERVQ